MTANPEETLAATVREMLGVLLYEDDDVEARGAAHAADAALRSLVVLVVSERAAAAQYRASANRIDAERQRERADKLEQSLLEHIDESVNWQERTERAEKALREIVGLRLDETVTVVTAQLKARKEMREIARAALSGSDEQKPGLAGDTEERET